MSKSAPRRLIDGGGSLVGRSLVRAGRSQRPSPQRSAAAIAAALAVVEGTAAAGEPRPSAAPSGSGAPPSGLTALAGKVVLALGVVGALVVGASYGLGHRSPAPTTPPAAARSSVAIPPAPPEETSAPGKVEMVVSVEDLPRAPSQVVRTNGSSERQGPADTDHVDAGISLAPELEVLEQRDPSCVRAMRVEP